MSAIFLWLMNLCRASLFFQCLFPLLVNVAWRGFNKWSVAVWPQLLSVLTSKEIEQVKRIRTQTLKIAATASETNTCRHFYWGRATQSNPFHSHLLGFLDLNFHIQDFTLWIIHKISSLLCLLLFWRQNATFVYFLTFSVKTESWRHKLRGFVYNFSKMDLQTKLLYYLFSWIKKVNCLLLSNAKRLHGP